MTRLPKPHTQPNLLKQNQKMNRIYKNKSQQNTNCGTTTNADIAKERVFQDNETQTMQSKTKGNSRFFLKLAYYFFIFLFLNFVIFSIVLRILDFEIGIDMQPDPCIGRIFIYKVDKLSNVEKIEQIRNTRKNISSSFSYLSNNKDYRKYVLGNRNIAFKLKEDIYPFKKGQVLIKEIVGLPNDYILSNDKGLFITQSVKENRDYPKGKQSSIYTYTPPTTPTTSTTPAIQYDVSRVYKKFYYLDRKLKENEIYVYAQHNMSLDSRILGPIDTNKIELFTEVYQIW